jgi:DNA primase
MPSPRSRTATEKEARQIILKHTRIPMGGILDHISFSGTRKRVDYEDEVAQDERAYNSGTYTFLPKNALEYLTSRGISEHAILKWGIGYDEETERIAVPGLDERQVFKFLIRRAVGRQEPKYLYTPGAIKTNILFGLCYLDRTVLESLGLVLVEGSLDTIRFHEHDLGSTLGTLGSGLSRRQVRLIDSLGPRRVYSFFDKDSAGVENVYDVHEKLHGKFPHFVCLFPSDKEDPAELTRKEAWRQIERAIPFGTFNRKVKGLTRNAALTRR